MLPPFSINKNKNVYLNILDNVQLHLTSLTLKGQQRSNSMQQSEAAYII